MSEEDPVVLYDIRERTYPSERGDSFRSLQVFKCWVCHALTNEVIMAGIYGYGVRAVCPCAAEEWHHELEDKIRLKSQPHPQSYLDELEREIEAMRQVHAPEVPNDIVGEPDFSLERSMTNVRAHRQTEGERQFLERVAQRAKTRDEKAKE